MTRREWHDIPQKPDTLKQEILNIIAMSGELPLSALKRIKGGTEYKKKLVHDLKAEKLIRKYRNDRVSALRATALAKKELLLQNPVRFQFFSGRNMYVSELPARQRFHRIAETLIMMHNAGVEVYRDRKAPVFSRPHSPSFYSAPEIKIAMGDEAVKINGSRATGLLVLPSGAYLTYHTGDTLMRWNSRQEVKMRELVRFAMRPLPVYGLLIGSRMSLALNILQSRGGYKLRYYMVDDTFESMCFLPDSSDGDRLLRLMGQPEQWREFSEQAAAGMQPVSAWAAVDCDAIASDGRPVLLALDFNLKRIQRFVLGLSIRSLSGLVVCFDFQEPVIRAYCGALVEIRIVPFPE